MGTWQVPQANLCSKGALLLHQCTTTASNAHATVKHQQKPNGRWKETHSHIQSHLSLFACSCCFTIWPTVPNPRFSEIALAEGITRKNDQRQLSSATVELFPGGWGSDDRSWKTKIPKGEAWAIQIHWQETAGPIFDSATNVLFFWKQVRSLTKTKRCISGDRVIFSLLPRLASE